MDFQYAPDGVCVGDELGKVTRWPLGKVIAIGKAVVVVRNDAGFTRTLLRKRVSHPARNRPWKKPEAKQEYA